MAESQLQSTMEKARTAAAVCAGLGLPLRLERS